MTIPSRYTEAERTYILLALERDCLRLALANGGPTLSDVADVHLRAVLQAEVEHAQRRLPEVERQLRELGDLSIGEAERKTSPSRQLVPA
jgi:hypothetical protein